MRRATLAILLALGCGEADEGFGPRPTWPVPGCETIDHTPCDVSAEACQARLHALAACLRDQAPGPLPTISILTEAELRAYFEAGIEPRPDPDHFERALVLFDLAETGALRPESRIDDRVASVAGLYRFAADDVLLVDRGDPFDDPILSRVLVHELIHAEQDREVDLSAWVGDHDGTYDAATSRRALLEGEAHLHTTRYAAALAGIDPGAVDWALRFGSEVARAEEDVVAGGSPILASRFQYVFGARFTERAWSEGGQDAIAAHFAAPPASTHAFLTLEDLGAPTAPSAPVPGPGWSPVADDSLGAWGVFVALAVAADLDAARALAQAWRGDTFAVFAVDAGEFDEGATAAVWRVDLADENAAAEVAAMLDGPSPGGTYRNGTRVVAVRTDSTTSMAWAFTIE